MGGLLLGSICFLIGFWTAEIITILILLAEFEKDR